MEKEKGCDRETSLFIEAVRYAELERKELLNDEYGMMIRSVWELIDPIGAENRPKSIRTVIRGDDGNNVRFTAHSHEREPLTESYDDILIYTSMIDSGNDSAHYIIDRFCPKKII